MCSVLVSVRECDWLLSRRTVSIGELANFSIPRSLLLTLYFRYHRRLALISGAGRDRTQSAWEWNPLISGSGRDRTQSAWEWSQLDSGREYWTWVTVSIITHGLIQFNTFPYVRNLPNINKYLYGVYRKQADYLCKARLRPVLGPVPGHWKGHCPDCLVPKEKTSSRSSI